MACTFFGHRRCPQEVRLKLEKIIEELIQHQNESVFYVGNNGDFDTMVYSVLNYLKKTYSHIEVYIVLAYLPTGKSDEIPDSLFPEGMEYIPKRFAISHRNRWMVKNSDIIVSYITHNWGGAAQFTDYARDKGKRVINISE